MKNVVIILAVLVVVGGGIFLFQSSQKPQETVMPHPSEKMMPETSPEAMMEEKTDETMMEKGTVKEFVVEGKNTAFTPASLTVNQGDQVKITFKNVQGFHDFVLEEFEVDTETISTDKEVVVEFTADKAGTFEYYCSVGNHRAMGMTGTLTVK